MKQYYTLSWCEFTSFRVPFRVCPEYKKGSKRGIFSKNTQLAREPYKKGIPKLEEKNWGGKMGKNVPPGQKDVHVLVPEQYVQAAESAGYKKGQAVIIAMREKFGGILPNSVFKETAMYEIGSLEEAIKNCNTDRALHILAKLRQGVGKLAS
ncbi:hypothetical protein COU37_01725 [Candidatus Micrarchaeota archaeon CG10_big_fil_rev_8_21_14_0_10_45_29]|nr:MAG: hypothetical protein COU37_01725 [Candidatus Micrarchaeota archaeon CG10_big_fil_rev_8_21_14_0_10_45_29]